MFLLREENDGTTKSIKVGLNRLEIYASGHQHMGVERDSSALVFH
jgi:hypothetical protein